MDDESTFDDSISVNVEVLSAVESLVSASFVVSRYKLEVIGMLLLIEE